MSFRLLLLSDIHSQIITLDAILQKIKTLKPKVDCCLIAGDVTNFGGSEDAIIIMAKILEFIPKIYYCLGNCDSLVKTINIQNCLLLNNSFIHESFFSIVGISGHKPFPNLSIFEKLKKQKKRILLLTHAPPYNTLADLVGVNKHAGSKNIRKLIDDYSENIILSVCGHIHESRCLQQLGSNTIINPGPVTTGNYAIVDITSSALSGELCNLYS